MPLMKQCESCRFGKHLAENGTSFVVCDRINDEIKVYVDKQMTMPCYFFAPGDSHFIVEGGSDGPFASGSMNPKDAEKIRQGFITNDHNQTPPPDMGDNDDMPSPEAWRKWARANGIDLKMEDIMDESNVVEHSSDEPIDVDYEVVSESE